jgi:uncharacterized metal-binding protein YceD (DUF177 family)
MKRPHFVLSRPIAVADIPARGRDIKIEADADECAKIAAEFELPAVLSLSGSYHVRATKKGAHVEGRVKAHIRQICVVSLEPFETRIEEPVDLAFAQAPPRHKAQGPRGGEITVSLEDEDPPEPIVNGKIDLGAVTLEFLALSLDPYPRKPGVELAQESAGERNAEEEKPPSPFSVLASLAERKSGRK